MQKNRLEDERLKLIMGYNTLNPTTIIQQLNDATAQMRRDFDRLLNNKPTAGGWQVNVTKNAVDGDRLPVTPVNKTVAVLFTYTPEVGWPWDSKSTAGGNALSARCGSSINSGSYAGINGYMTGTLIPVGVTLVGGVSTWF